jgi:hypothetical protein
MAVLTVLAVVSISSHVRDSLRFPDGIDGAASLEDRQTLEQLNWVLLVLMSMLWLFLIAAAYYLSKRREWARIVVVCVFAFLAVSLLWNGGATFMIAVSGAGFPNSQNVLTDLGVPQRLFACALGSGLVALSYCCWRVVARLRSLDVRHAFKNTQDVRV